MGKLLFTILLSFLAKPLLAQYYYKDILSNKQLTADRAILKQEKIRKVVVHSFEADDQPSKGFFCEKNISKNYRTIETYSKSAEINKSILTTYFNEKGLLIKTIDSSEINTSTSDIEYDANGNIITITSNSHSSDEDFTTSLAEVRHYIYSDSGFLQKMFHIKNQKDTTEIDFTHDAKGNITEEIEVAVYGNHYYYYYDDQNRLTDIVRFNIVKQKPLPDFMFQYNDDGQLEQMIAIDEGVSSNYYLWKYVYDGPLRIKEKCYSKQKELLGYIEYEYK
jgi:hypothetical protein